MEFLPYFYKHCNSYLIHPLQTLKCSPYTHWFYDGMLQNIRILPRFLETLEFLSYLLLRKIVLRDF